MNKTKLLRLWKFIVGNTNIEEIVWCCTQNFARFAIIYSADLVYDVYVALFRLDPWAKGTGITRLQELKTTAEPSAANS